jgi:hypothetical protein
VSGNDNPAHGGVSFAVSPWALRGLIPGLGRTPALRGYPGGMDAAGLAQPGRTTGDDQPKPDSASAPPPGRRQRWGRPARRAPAGRGKAGAGGTSVWQQAFTVWRLAGLEWQRPPGWQSADADLQRTEPIPVVPAVAVPADAGESACPIADDAAGRGGQEPEADGLEPGWVDSQEPGTGGQDLAGDERDLTDSVRELAGDGQETSGAQEAADGGRHLTHSVREVAGGERETADGKQVAADGGRDLAGSGRETARGGQEAGAELTGGEPEPEPGPRLAGGGEPEPGKAGQEAGQPDGQLPAAGRQAPDGGGRAGHLGLAPRPGRQPRRGSRGVLIGAGVCVALIAVAVAGIVITGPLSAGQGGAPSGLVVASPSAWLADRQFAGPGGSRWAAVPPAVTGIAAAGGTVVAVGSQDTLPAARPLVLVSPNGGRTWRSAVLHAPAGEGTGPGAVPLLVAGGRGRWLAVAPDATWASADGRSWQLGPGIAPLSGGDRVRALARTRGGFVAAGENLRLRGNNVLRTPVLWTSTNGLTWQRRSARQLRLPAGKAQVVALRWVAARGSALMIAGEVARTVVAHRGRRTVSVIRQSAGVWLSRDGGGRWVRTDPPVSGGASAQLAGLAATGSGIVAVRPGRALIGKPDALAYVWTPGAGWAFGAALTGRHNAALHVTAVAGSDHGVVVAGTAGRSRVAFVSPRGWSWHETADLGRSSAPNATGVTVGPGGEVVAAGWRRPQSFLLLARGHRALAGQTTLAGAAAAGMSVNGLGAGPAGQVAVGHADGAPAIWLRPAGARWTRMTAATPPSWRGTGPGLTGVVRGGAGWLAVGGEGSPAGSAAELGAAGTLDSAVAPGDQQPILLTSPDGRSWRPPAGAGSLEAPGLTLTGVTAGQSGYVVAGVRSDHGQPAAALWWSANLTTWKPQGWWTGSPPTGAASALLAVAAGRTGFAAVGAVGTQPAVWLSRSGRSWQLLPLPRPAGASSAVLQRVAIQGHRITALGTQARPSGPVPFAAVSANGGRTWRETALPVPGGPAGVTALVAAGGGFLATGMSGTGIRDVIIWWSRDGLTWHPVRPAGNRLSGADALEITGLSGSGDVLTGVGYAVTPTGRHPVLWRIPVH